MSIEKDEIMQEEAFGEDIIQLINEDGETVDFFHIGTIEFEGKWYVMFEPAEQLEDIDEGEIVIFRLEAAEDGEDLFVPIEDQDELDRVFAEYERLLDEEDGCDCGCDGDCSCGN